MTTFQLNSFDQDLLENTTSIKVELIEQEGQRWFNVDNVNIYDTEGGDEEPFLFSKLREVLDLHIYELLRKIDELSSKLNIDCVIDGTRENGAEYYFLVDERILKQEVKRYIDNHCSNEQIQSITELIEE